ncbi:carbohydrate-binding module family 1 protein [Durotheca rogersii]|uniref:carbohydrate-binding module family 1 protein n=1 Tax=Durotheca rogersii TaxID=419775 RepID=UPI00221E3A75|nr:carbohydrate-binding module family 1 protein [Durotheca rogersii]KAI5857386.1 carbohydrate-binding module family 1 protein [Durotheca rogersii]
MLTMHAHAVLIPSGLLLGTAAAQQPAYAQCGGVGYTGQTDCVAGYACQIVNDYYHQCLPGQATTQPTRAPTATITTTGTASVTETTGGGDPSYPTTLESGYYWVRAVASPNFHSYLQAAPTATPSPGPGNAHLLAAARAGQFDLVDGQLAYYVPGAAATLYMHIENPADKTQRALATWFDGAPNSYGAFAFQGDTLTWSVADITRPNAAAWFVCGDEKRLYVNTGAYAYDTPAGCADQTIHSYGGSTADI